MGASLAWLKVVDTGRWSMEGAHVHARLDNVVQLLEVAPSEAAPFVIARAWSHFDTAFTETWRIANRYGQTIREGVPREVLAVDANPATGGGIVDEVDGVTFEFADSGYQVILEVEGREVARADFEVREPTGTQEDGEGG